MKKLLFVFNPHAGKGQISGCLVEILNEMVKGAYEITIHPTQAKDEARWLVEKQAKNFDLIVCSGGDGTLDEVVSGLIKSGVDIPIGYIPAGSTNDYANSLGLPSDMVEAAKVAVMGKPKKYDVGFFGDKSFVYVAAFGIFTDVAYETDQELKNILGHAAYILEGAKRLGDIQSFNMKVTNKDEVMEGEFILGMITNSTSVGGFKGMTGEDVKLDDGKFEVTLIKKPQNVMELNLILASIAKLVDDTDMVYTFKTDGLTVECEDEKSAPWTLDGEYGGNPKKVDITAKKKAVRIMMPSVK
ncbi:MAG: diacylglycerol kinase family lipid kinase [Lachnospiraceae bacterium]|nr:diacylglycerol kinase family lipid kinase [Lachnospiraceae bacterium]